MHKQIGDYKEYEQMLPRSSSRTFLDSGITTDCPRTRAFNIAQFQDGKPQQVLPSVLAEHEAEVASFQEYCSDIVLKLLTLFSIGLEVKIVFPFSRLS